MLAVYYPGNKDAVREYGARLEGRAVVDITNPVNTEMWDDVVTPSGTSSAEEVAEFLPEGSPVVKAFNTTFAPTLVAGEVGGQQLDVLIAGDDDDAKRKVAQLVSENDPVRSTSARLAGHGNSSSLASCTSRAKRRPNLASAARSS